MTSEIKEKPFSCIWWDEMRAHLDQDIEALEEELQRKKELHEFASRREREARQKSIARWAKRTV